MCMRGAGGPVKRPLSPVTILRRWPEKSVPIRVKIRPAAWPTQIGKEERTQASLKQPVRIAPNGFCVTV